MTFKLPRRAVQMVTGPTGSGSSPAATRAALAKTKSGTSDLAYERSIDERMSYALKTPMATGLKSGEIEKRRERYGRNTVVHKKKDPLILRLARAFLNPFTVILIGLAIVSLITDVILAAPGDEDPKTVIVITVMVIIAGTLRFVQETRSNNAAEKLTAMVTNTCAVIRDREEREIPIEEVVVGDIVRLAAGDMIPADMRILSSKDLFVSQSSLTGESEPIEKYPIKPRSEEDRQSYDAPTDKPCMAFMGSNVVSGSGLGTVVSVGGDSLFGELAKHLTGKTEKTSFDIGLNKVSWVFIKFICVMVPVIFVVNGLTKHDWVEAAFFGLSVAVGVTPEMLPTIVTACLAKGAVTLSRQKVIVKNLNSIQNLGAIDVLCTDKTGTLTQDKVVLEQHLDVNGREDSRVLRHGFLNSYFQTGLKNLMDLAIIERTHELAGEDPALADLETRYTKVDEIPFDFERRRMSVVVADKSGKTQMITKGAIEEMLTVSSFVDLGDRVVELTDEMRRKVLERVDDLNDDGMRVLGVAQKTNPSPVGQFGVKDECEMVLIGYLAFLDPPKESTADALRALNNYGVDVKILTGDNERVAKCVCRQVGLKVDDDNVVLGSTIEGWDDEHLLAKVESITVFAKLSPMQKTRVVKALRERGHTVGFMGDGINDAAAMRAADVGISVDTAVDIAKESADVILLEKDLMVLEQGIVEGRRIYTNMVKYIKMTASSNFGNMFSVVVASAFLPYLPMQPLQILMLNLIYDISCITMPWDNVDDEFLRRPRPWDANGLARFMIWIGPTSSVFDITTYLLMYFIICPQMLGAGYTELDPAGQAMFAIIAQSGWFVESMWSQSMVIHMLRTRKIPFIQSRAAAPLMTTTFIGCFLITWLPFSPLNGMLNMHPITPIYFAWLALTILLYLMLAQTFKTIYCKRYGTLL